MKVHLVTIAPNDTPNFIESARRILNWNKARGVPGSVGPGQIFMRRLLMEGMLCEIDDSNLEEARALGTVTIHGTKDRL